jgi:hypothetical protein
MCIFFAIGEFKFMSTQAGTDYSIRGISRERTDRSMNVAGYLIKFVSIKDISKSIPARV